MNAWPVALFWALAAWGMASRRPVLVYLFFASMPFGSFAVVPPAITGGLTFIPTPVVALLLALRAFADRDGPAAFLSLAAQPAKLLLLTLYWLVAAVATAFLPRLFAGTVPIVPIRGDVGATMPLHPSAQNLSQFAYLTIAVLTVFTFARLLETPAMRQHALRAMVLGGGLTIATGLLDHAAQALPMGPLLQPFRTASYALLTDIEVLGGKRVVGLMPEASAFGGLCLALLAALCFYRRAIADRALRDGWTPLVVVLLAICAWLSTSSGTLVGLGVLAIVLALEWSLRFGTGERSGAVPQAGMRGEMAATACLAIALALAALLRPQMLEPASALVERMVLEKAHSASFDQRGMWRSTALAALARTHGMGVGLGGTRASSSVVAVFSSTGILGGLLFHAFLLQCLLRRPPSHPADAGRLLSGFRFAIIPPFAVSLMVGDADFGGIMAFSLGLASAVTATSPSPARLAALPRTPAAAP